MIKKQIGALRKQLDETETTPSALKYGLQEPTPVIPHESRRPPQVPEDGTVEFESRKQDIQSRAKAAVAYGRSFIA